VIEIQRNGNRPYSAWENPFEEGDSPPPKLDTFRSARDFAIYQLLESPNVVKDGIELTIDYARATLEGTDLLFNPIYRDDNLPRGDGSDVTLGPGFMGNELAYLLPKENLRRLGWNAKVYPPRYGLHIGPTESEVDPFVRYLKERNEKSGEKGHVIAHSKFGHVALLAAITRTQEFTDCVDQLVLVGSPIPEKVNFQIGTAYLVAQAAFRGNDFRLTAFAEDEEALAKLKNVRLIVLKIINDPAMDGLHLGAKEEIIEVQSSHTGALLNRNNLIIIHKGLARPISADQEDHGKLLQFPKDKAA